MLTAGLDRQAARWSGIAGGLSGVAGDRAWALLALGSPDASVGISTGRVSEFVDRDESDGRIRSKLLLAGLAGLERLPADDLTDVANDLGVRLGMRNRWTVMIDGAAARHQEGTVALLAATGMQTTDWRGVPPEYLFHVVRSLKLAGLEFEARMIAAEALSRV